MLIIFKSSGESCHSDSEKTNIEVARIDQNKAGGVLVALNEENVLEGFKMSFTKDGFLIDGYMNIKTVSEANGVKTRGANGRMKNEHWRTAWVRHRQQKSWTKIMLREFKEFIALPCKITLTRYAPEKLDKYDNLPMAFKWVLDAICELITGDERPGRADGLIEDKIEVIYKQETSKSYYIRISLEF